MKIQCVLFDLDGVLVDACEWHYITLNEALRQIVGFEISREDHISKYNGLPTTVKLRMLGLEAPIALRIEALKQMKTLEVIAERAQIMPEKQELHSYLKSQGIKIACVTNSIHTTATAMLRQTGQINFMDLIVSNGDIPRNKPHPDCYNFAVKTLGVDPCTCLCVEDSPNGIEAARASCVPNLWMVSNPSDVTLKNYKEIVK
jgi:hypothetical protein